ncbi:hypothetical protein [Acetobacter tropicalis]|nr:hypothetical protein [Acetobacter tropicalis]
MSIFFISLGFLLACMWFVYSVNNADKWGDFATWFSGFAALFAFVAAVKANNQNANQFSTSLKTQIISSYMAIIQEKSQLVNKSIKDLSVSRSKYAASSECFNLANHFLDCIEVIKSASDGSSDIEKRLITIFFHLIDKRFFGEIKNNDISRYKLKSDSSIPWNEGGDTDPLLGLSGNFRDLYLKIEVILAQNEDCI